MNNQNAGLLRRFFAHILDGSIFSTILIAPVALLSLGWESENSMDKTALVITYILCILLLSGIIKTLYTSYFTSKFGGTMGKLLFGLKIQDFNENNNIDFKRAFYRNFVGYIFSSQFFGLGFWKIIKNPEKRGWHDELFNTKVVKTKGPWLGLIALLISWVVFVGIIFFAGNNVTRGLTAIDTSGINTYPNTTLPEQPAQNYIL